MISRLINNSKENINLSLLTSQQIKFEK